MSRLVRILAIALTVSVAVNVFLAGFWAARWVRRSQGYPDRAVAMRDGGRRPSEAHAPGFGPLWRQHGAALAGPRQAVIAARLAVRDAIVAEPFRPEALEGALARLRTENDQAQVTFHRSLVAVVKEMSPEERKKVADSRWFASLERAEPPPGR